MVGLGDTLHSLVFTVTAIYVYGCMSNRFTVLLIPSVMPMTCYMIYICTFVPPYMHVRYLAYMPDLFLAHTQLHWKF